MKKDADKRALEVKKEQVAAALELRKQNKDIWIAKESFKADQRKAEKEEQRGYDEGKAQQKAISDRSAAIKAKREALAKEKRVAGNKTKTYKKVKVGEKLFWAEQTKDGLILTKHEADKGGVNVYSGTREQRAAEDQKMQVETHKQKMAKGLLKAEETILANMEDPAVAPHVDMFQKSARDKSYTYIYEKKPKKIFGMNAGFTEGVKRIDLPKKKDGTQIVSGDIWDTLEMNKGKQFLLPNSTKPIVINTYQDVLKYIGAYE